MNGLFAGIFTEPSYDPAFTNMSHGDVRPAGASSMACCMVAYWPVPSVATTALNTPLALAAASVAVLIRAATAAMAALRVDGVVFIDI